MKQILSHIVAKWAVPMTEVIILIVALYIFLWPVKLYGMGMEETINNNDWVLSSRFATVVSEPAHGDLILFKVSVLKKPLVKRVIALPGDKVQLVEGVIYVNDEPLEEKYRLGSLVGDFEQTVEEEHLFILSDNSDSVDDSRSYGQIPVKDVKSKILLKFYPFDEMTVFF